MSNEFCFGLFHGHLPRKAGDIARRHEARLVNYVDERGKKRGWFCCRNFGEPYNSAVARAVRADLAAAGIRIPEPGEYVG